MEIQELAMEYLHDLCRRPTPVKGQVDSGIQGERRVLQYLHETKNPATPGEMSCFHRLTTARIANILLSLEKKGMIERRPDPDDRRKVMVYLTEAGTREAEKGRQECLSWIRCMLEYLGEDDARELVRLESRITEMILECERNKRKE